MTFLMPNGHNTYGVSVIKKTTVSETDQTNIPPFLHTLYNNYI